MAPCFFKSPGCTTQIPEQHVGIIPRKVVTKGVNMVFAVHGHADESSESKFVTNHSISPTKNYPLKYIWVVGTIQHI